MARWLRTKRPFLRPWWKSRARAEGGGEKVARALGDLAEPEAGSLLVSGIGGGVVLEDVPESVKHIDVIED